MALEFHLMAEKKLNRLVARMQPVQITLGKQAEHIAGDVRSNIDNHIDTGEYLMSIKLSRGKVDWFVYSDDPRAVYKEYPHLAKNGELVGGVGAFRKALAEAPSKGLRGVSF